MAKLCMNAVEGRLSGLKACWKLGRLTARLFLCSPSIPSSVLIVFVLMMDVTLRDERMRELQRSYMDFLDDSADQDLYAEKVRDMIQQNQCRLVVNLNDLRRKFATRCNLLLNNSFEEIIAFEKSLKEFVTNIDPAFSKSVGEFFVGFEGSFGGNHVTPRSLSARYLGKLICIEGIVTKCSLVRPKVVKSVHYCPATQKTIERRYTDMTSLDAFPSSSAYPTKDEDGNPLETEYGLSTYKDHQTVTIQEMPEKAPPGQLPRSVEIVCDNDLVDKCKPGDRILAVGVYRCLPNKQAGYTSGNFRAILLCNNIKVMSKEMKPVFMAEDLTKIRKFARQKNVDLFEELANSLAPTIHGHEYVKQALLCMLLGGVEKTLENGTRLRGDINILLIGDPGVAKSQMLRYVLNTAPRAIPTTGRGSTGVGLTAAVTVDPETGDKRLEAGAMVLADRGIVCIDEFDKMSDMDRTAIHEVMEQGRVSIAKVGIHAQLNARCSVLAAANPIYGRYDQYKTPMENIGLQDSLLSRFDVLFVLLDEMDPEKDGNIADHVLRIHRYRPSDQQDGDVLPFGGGVDALTTEDLTNDTSDLTECQIYDKHDNVLHGPKDKGKRMVSMQFMRKYIQFAKSISPQLTKESRDLISEEYVKLRAEDIYNKDTQTARTQPVTVRTLETLIRLSTAHARARLSKYVEAQDAEASIKLIEYAFFKKVLERKRPRSQDENDYDDSGHESDEEVINPNSMTRSNRKRSRKSNEDENGSTDQGQPSAPSTGPQSSETSDDVIASSAKKQKKSTDDPYDIDADEEAPAPPGVSKKKKTAEAPASSAGSTPQSSTEFDAAKYARFKKALSSVFYSQRTQEMGLEHLEKSVNDVDSGFVRSEVLIYLEKMQEANQIMLSGDMVYLI